MGVDTVARLKSRVEIEEVFKFIKDNIDMDCKLSLVSKKEKFVDKSTSWIKECYDDIDGHVYNDFSYLHFDYKGESRTLTYIYNSYNTHSNLKYYQDNGLSDTIKSETTYLSLGCSGYSIEVMKLIVSAFGGWLDENDCDDKEFYYIEKGKDAMYKPIKTVTLEEVYEKFGEIVIIK